MDGCVLPVFFSFLLRPLPAHRLPPHANVNLVLLRSLSRLPPAHPARLLSWFLDSPAAAFDVQRMALSGKAFGKDVGMWFAPSATAGAVRWVSLSIAFLGGLSFAVLPVFPRSLLYRAATFSYLLRPTHLLAMASFLPLSPFTTIMTPSSVSPLVIFFSLHSLACLVLHGLDPRRRLPCLRLGVSVTTDGTLYQVVYAASHVVCHRRVSRRRRPHGADPSSSSHHPHASHGEFHVRAGGAKSPATQKRWGDRLLLLLLGLRLGLDGVNPVYYETIKMLYTFRQSVGIAGGRPSSSYSSLECATTPAGIPSIAALMSSTSWATVLVIAASPRSRESMQK
ncbi:hypothetical protein C8J57DRAFT_1622391 [Mycena rebaudengoi]|nr:hypothetical protein C8J57DRAFT_1622391 [Mycena rebaudengoi]